MQFKEYLQEQYNHHEKTIGIYEKHISDFYQWLSTRQLTIQALDYQCLVNHVRYQQQKGSSPSKINTILRAIRYYIDYKNHENPGNKMDNPAENYIVKTPPRSITSNLMPYAYLLEMFTRFADIATIPKRPERCVKRYKLQLGLLIFQASRRGEIERLKKRHFDLDKAVVKIPSSRQSAGRVLPLHGLQVVGLQEYLQDMGEEDYLFGKELNPNYITIIIRILKPHFDQLESYTWVRKSVIAHWVKHYHLREAQYMAGHRCISATERYRQDNLEDLQKKLEQHHPLSPGSSQ